VTNSASASYLALQPGFGHDLTHDLGAILAYAVVGAALIGIGFVALDLTTPGQLRELVRDGLPNAVTIASGGIFSMSLIVVASIFSSSGHLAEGLIITTAFGLLGVLVQVLAARLMETALRIDVGAVLADDRFNPASIAVAVTHVAMGMIVAISLI
jgi:uncharacterized membrane protein YjfL (UPF0719 family)